MQLQQFVTESLVQIVRGIENASKQLADSDAVVSPGSISCSLAMKPVYSPGEYLRQVELVEFDVAVYASEGTETKRGIGILVGSIGLGTQGKSDAASSSQSRLKFGAPMALPQGDKTN